MSASFSATIPGPEKFKALIWKQVNFAMRRIPKGKLGIEPEDLYQEGLLVYAKFCHDFDPGRGCQFITGFYQRLWQHLWAIVKQSHRKVTLTQWDESDTEATHLEATHLEDMVADRSCPTAREALKRDLAEIGLEDLSRDTWLVVRAILDPPDDLIRFAFDKRGSGHTQANVLFRWLGFDKVRKDAVKAQLQRTLGWRQKKVPTLEYDSGERIKQGVRQWLAERNTSRTLSDSVVPQTS